MQHGSFNGEVFSCIPGHFKQICTFMYSENDYLNSEEYCMFILNTFLGGDIDITIPYYLVKESAALFFRYMHLYGLEFYYRLLPN